jgi:hypothetical protein
MVCAAASQVPSNNLQKRRLSQEDNTVAGRCLWFPFDCGHSADNESGNDESDQATKRSPPTIE